MDPCVAPSPFMESNPNDYPCIKPLDLPQDACVHLKQHTKEQDVKVPLTFENSPSFQAIGITPITSLTFRRFVAGCMTNWMATIVSSSASVCKHSEIAELLASVEHSAEPLPLKPRGCCVSLCLGACAEVYAKHQKCVIDAFSAVSNTVLSQDSVHRLASLMRFSIYRGKHETETFQCLGEDWCSKPNGPFALVVRWPRMGPAGCTIVEKTIFMNTLIDEMISSRSNPTDVAANAVLNHIIELSTCEEDLYLPSQFFNACSRVHTSSTYESIFKHGMQNICDIIDVKMPYAIRCKEDEESGDASMTVLPFFMRLSLKTDGVEGVCSNSSVHAVPLCASSKYDKAVAMAKKHREGLPPDEASSLDMYTCYCTYVPIDANAFASRYAECVKPGEPFGSTDVFRLCRYVLSAREASHRFYMFSCNVKSVVPSQKSICSAASGLIKLSMDYANEVQSSHDETINRASSAAGMKRNNKSFESLQELVEEQSKKITPDEHSICMSALGVDMTSNSITIGEAISYYMKNNAKSSFLDMLIKLSVAVGLSATLSSAFSKCISIISEKEKKYTKAKLEMERLKTLMNSALLLQCAEKARSSASGGGGGSHTQDDDRLYETSRDDIVKILKTNRVAPSEIKMECTLRNFADSFSKTAIPRGPEFVQDMLNLAFSAHEMQNIAVHIDETTPRDSNKRFIKQTVEYWDSKGCDAIHILGFCLVMAAEVVSAEGIFLVCTKGSSSQVVYLYRLCVDGSLQSIRMENIEACAHPIVVFVKISEDQKTCVLSAAVKKKRPQH